MSDAETNERKTDEHITKGEVRCRVINRLLEILDSDGDSATAERMEVQVKAAELLKDIGAINLNWGHNIRA